MTETKYETLVHKSGTQIRKYSYWSMQSNCNIHVIEVKWHDRILWETFMRSENERRINETWEFMLLDDC